MVDVDTIAQALAPAVSELGLDLYDVELSGSGRARILRVLVDREGGVDLDAIADATQAVSPLLDAPPLDAVIAGPYALEVSSPGLERPLRTPTHFARAVGETISVKTRAGDDHGARRVHGVVTAADATGFELALDDGTVERIAYDDVTQARTVFEWGSEAEAREVQASDIPERDFPKRAGAAMNSEMMEALENIEREKGISIEIMLEALANALLTAYKRMPDAAEEALVEIDMETGAIKVIAQELDEDGNVTREWDDTPTDFGRIAAQTAKQVIFQRIREAEREMKYEEYAGREGDIVTGIIQQTDARYTLLDLGKVEALLPQAEQVQNEHYDHGSRLKAYIVEVRKTAKGPQIVVSRTHPGLVKRLFELEVPEIVDGVVELKAIAREPGHRTKLAVASNDNNVDPVGACVGARGSRVRMVVNELRGEKVDIVPYSDEPSEFVMKALAPARVREVRIHPDTGTAEVIVPDFQLSLAIGKEGQNARLAARLTGWRVDIKSESQLARRGVRRRRRVRRGRVGHQRERRTGVAAGRGRRGDLGRRGRVRRARDRHRAASKRPAARRRSTPRLRPRPRMPAPTPRVRGRTRRKPPGRRGRRRSPRPHPCLNPCRSPRRRRPTASAPTAGPVRTCIGCRRAADVEELVRIRADPHRARARGGSGAGRLALPVASGCVPRRGAAPADGGPGTTHLDTK